MQLVNEQVNVGEYEEVKIGEGEGINISVEFTGKNSDQSAEPWKILL